MVETDPGQRDEAEQMMGEVGMKLSGSQAVAMVQEVKGPWLTMIRLFGLLGQTTGGMTKGEGTMCAALVAEDWVRVPGWRDRLLHVGCA